MLGESAFSVRRALLELQFRLPQPVHQGPLRFQFLSTVRLGVKSLLLHKLRSVLTTLGIVIGIVTVTLMGTAIQGLNNAFLKAISTMGADVLYVTREDWSGSNSEEEWRKIQKRPRLTVEQAGVLEHLFEDAL